MIEQETKEAGLIRYALSSFSRIALCWRLLTFRKPRRFRAIGVPSVAHRVVLGLGDAILLHPDPAVRPFDEHLLAVVYSHSIRDLDGQGELALDSDIGLRNGIRELYRAANPPVSGIGFAATRDLIAFLRRDIVDDAGTANHLAADHHLAAAGAGQARAVST